MSGDFFYHHNVMPRGQLYVPKESSFPLSVKYTDVARQTKTNLDKVVREQHRGTVVEIKLFSLKVRAAPRDSAT